MSSLYCLKKAHLVEICLLLSSWREEAEKDFSREMK